MKPIIIIIIFFYLLISLLTALVQADGEFLQSACNKTDDYGFCMGTLGAEKKSYAVSDLRDLVYITIDITAKNGTATLSLINDLIFKNQSDHELVSCLKVCQKVYRDDVLYGLPEARDLLKQKRDDDAREEISSAMFISSTCSDAFEEGKLPVPFPKENDDNSRLGSLGVQFMNVIIGH